MSRDEAVQQVADDLPQFKRFSEWLTEHNHQVGALSDGHTEKTGRSVGSWTFRIAIVSVLWQIVELPVEYWCTVDGMKRAALVFSTLVWIAIVALTLRGSTSARGVLVFLCALSVLAIAPALPVEYATFHLAFWLSLIECLLKLTLFVAFLSRFMERQE